jgi:hypothetical protein
MKLSITLALLLVPLPHLAAQTWTTAVFTPGSDRADQLVTGGVRVSISQQGAAVLVANSGRLIKGVGIGAVSVCNESQTAARGLDSGTIYQAIQSMVVSTLGVNEAELVLDRAVSTSRAQTMLDIGTAVGAAVALGASVSDISKTWKIALAGVPVGLGFTNIYFERRLPSDTTTKQFLLRSTGSHPDFVLSPGSCVPDGRVFLYRYFKDWNPQSIVLE